jgi:hypothetical protein
MASLRPILLVCACSCAVFAAEKDKPAAEPQKDYVRIRAEIRGTIQVEMDKVRVRVVYAASCLVVFQDVWELDFGENRELKESAAKWNGKTVVVTGAPSRPFVGLDGKVYGTGSTLAVQTLTLAPAK